MAPPALDLASEAQPVRSPQSPAQWRDGTSSTLKSSMIARHAAQERVQRSLRSHQLARNDLSTNYKNLQTCTSEKVSSTNELKELLAKRIRSVQASSLASKKCLGDLQAADGAMILPLELNVWRVAMRAQRPERELVRDPFELALEEEHKALTSSREALKAAAKDMEGIIWDLGKTLEELRFDWENKTDSAAIDEACLAAMERRPTRPQSRPGTPSSPLSAGLCSPTARETPRKLALSTGGMLSLIGKAPTDPHANVEANLDNEESRKRDSASLMLRANQAEHAAQATREHCEYLIADTRARCERALRKVEVTMTDRINETQDMCRRLEESTRDTQKSIVEVAHFKALTKGEMQSHDPPADLVGSQDLLRGTRMHRERISDPVTSASERHRHGLARNYAMLEGCYDEEEDSLKKLQKEKAALELDFADKTAALNLDIACRNQDGFVPSDEARAVPRYPGVT